ncbi:hypothetical protein MML48_1g07656 [Holotrichia oblita]|uniref:Uncharacterized protein n=1 Tax=Holotrichia oblita TaxID=644536 RepID=A0ACB9TS01_HOLOL|nr:hypothetical protein MML48_1g07656 [Holotrichia oblita]
MSDWYNKEQKQLQDLWLEILSDDESNRSEFGDVYLSDAYSPSSDFESDSSSSSKDVSHSKKRLRDQKIAQNVPDQNDGDSILEQVIEDVIAKYAIQDDEEEPVNIEELNHLKWSPVDGTSLKQFPFTVSDPGIKAQLYTDYIGKYPYDVLKLFITDETIDQRVQT